MSKTVTEAIKDRRSVRKYKDVEIDPNKVKKCIENATLALIAVICSYGNLFMLLTRKYLRKYHMLALIKMQQKHLKIWLYLLLEEINGELELRKI